MSEVFDLRQRAGLTQSALAEAARTSQPTIAAYEKGSKIPSMRTLKRIAEAVGLRVSVDFISPMTREDRRSLVLHHAIARQLERDPHRALRLARVNLKRMVEQNPNAKELLGQWRAILTLPVDAIVTVLTDEKPYARELRHVTPFAGVLSASERAEVYRAFKAREGRQR